jgi:AcrR family transcriptional regulator
MTQRAGAASRPSRQVIGFDIKSDRLFSLTLCQLVTIVQSMSYIAERRVEEKERRRAEILDAAEALYAKQGWESVTVEQVARGARLSRALVYVYYRDKQELLFAIGERAMGLLRDRFIAAAASQTLGIEKVEAIGRAYMGYAFEFPHYFDFLSRFHAHSPAPDPGSHDLACQACGDEAILVVVEAIQAGVHDGSIRKDIGDPMMMAVSLWAFSHGLIQLMMVKGSDMARLGLGIPQLSVYGFDLLRRTAQSQLAPAATT